MSSATSTVVRLKASELIRRPCVVSGGAGKSRCHGWLTAPGLGTSKPISTKPYEAPNTVSQTAVTHG
jgi:hypothetical protein